MSYDFSNLWIEKFRPKTLSDFICTSFTKESLLSFKNKEEIPNLLFIGAAGIGKTSAAKIIVNDILDCQYLYINASDENGIDTIRNKVMNFAQTMSIDGKIKVIILDECDGLSMDAQRALRNTMEEFSGITRFILTANYKYKIIPALQSRCQSFDLTPPLDLAVKRCASILKQECITVPDDQKVKLVEFIKGTYPDLRKCLNQLQQNSTTGKLNKPQSTGSGEDELLMAAAELFKNGKILEGRQQLMQYISLYPTRIEDTYRWMYDNLDLWGTAQEKKDANIVIIRNGLANLPLVGIPEISMAATLCELTTL